MHSIPSEMPKRKGTRERKRLLEEIQKVNEELKKEEEKS